MSERTCGFESHSDDIAGWCNGSTSASEAFSIRSKRVPATHLCEYVNIATHYINRKRHRREGKQRYKSGWHDRQMEIGALCCLVTERSKVADCNSAVDKIPVAGSNPADSSTFWRCRTVGLVQEFAKLPGGVSCLEGSNPSISAK